MGQGERAARLLGAAVAARETIGAPQSAEDGADVEQAVAAAWAAELSASQVLTLGKAVAGALALET